MTRRRLAACTLLLLPLPAIAAGVEFRVGDAVTIAADEVIEGDLYISGETATIDGVVRGDVVVAAREITLTGRAEGDFIAAGQVIVVRGAVGDDMRVAGMVLHLGPDATVADHVVSTGYSLEAEPGSRVGGEFVFSGAKARLAGDFESGLRLAVSAVEIAGNVAGSVEAEVAGGMSEAPWFERFVPVSIPIPTVADGFTVADSARIGGRLSYTAPLEGVVPDAAVGGGVEWDSESIVTDAEAAEEDRGPTLLSRVGSAARRFSALLIVGLLLLWRAPTWAGGRIDRLSASPLGSFGWGIAGAVGTPIAALIVVGVTILVAALAGAVSLGRLALLVVLLGLTLLVLLVVGFLVTILFGAPVLVSATGGRALLQRVDPARATTPYLPFAVGLAILTLLTSLPIVGSGLGLLAIVLGLGPFVQWLFALPRRSVG